MALLLSETSNECSFSSLYPTYVCHSNLVTICFISIIARNRSNTCQILSTIIILQAGVSTKVHEIYGENIAKDLDKYIDFYCKYVHIKYL